MDTRRTLLLALRGLAVMATIGIIGAVGLTRAIPSHATSPGPYYYCVVGNANSGGINRTLVRPAGGTCFATLDSAEQALNPEAYQIIKSIPAGVEAQVGPHTSYDAKACSMVTPASDALRPGQRYFVRCTNGIIMVAIGGRPSTGHGINLRPSR
ncbi:MAG: hypothetical protein ACRDFX_11340 [Chloroflexota bacterium]